MKMRRRGKEMKYKPEDYSISDTGFYGLDDGDLEWEDGRGNKYSQLSRENEDILKKYLLTLR